MVASNYDVPAVLGEIFESVAGAVFIDSGMSLDAVWRCYLPFLRQELGIRLDSFRRKHLLNVQHFEFTENFSISNPRFALKELNDMLSRKATFG